MILTHTQTVPGTASPHGDRIPFLLASTLWLRSLGISARAWARRSVILRGSRREPSPEALVRAVRGAWPRYWDRHVTRARMHALRIPRLPYPAPAGADPARGAPMR